MLPGRTCLSAFSAIRTLYAPDGSTTNSDSMSSRATHIPCRGAGLALTCLPGICLAAQSYDCYSELFETRVARVELGRAAVAGGRGQPELSEVGYSRSRCPRAQPTCPAAARSSNRADRNRRPTSSPEARGHGHPAPATGTPMSPSEEASKFFAADASVLEDAPQRPRRQVAVVDRHRNRSPLDRMLH